MKYLTAYTKNGYDFILVQRVGDIAIFHGCKEDHNGQIIQTWEGIHIQSHNGREVHGTYCPPAEYPPSNEQWGSKGFTFASRDAAWEWMEKQTIATP